MQDDLSQKVKDYIAKATQMAPRHEEQTRKIASHFKGSIPAIGPIKSHKRALEKVEKEYNGDHTRLKDVIRSTVVAKDHHQLKEIAKHMETHKNLITHKEQHKHTDPLGYSGHIFHYHYPGGVKGEIQANTPHMIYGKERENDARAIIGHSKYEEIKKKTGIEGGHGHAYYEKWRSLPEGHPHLKIHEIASRAYYDSIRKHYE